MHPPNAAPLHRRSCSLQDSLIWVSVWNEDSRQDMIWREVEPHCVHLQCTCQMLCFFSADVVESKAQRCECLCEMKIGKTWRNGAIVVIIFVVGKIQSVRGFSEEVVWGKRICFGRSLKLLDGLTYLVHNNTLRNAADLEKTRSYHRVWGEVWSILWWDIRGVYEGGVTLTHNRVLVM